MIYNPADIEYEIEKKYMTALRAIFEIDTKFRYNEDDTLTKVIITPEYPMKGSSFKTPHIVATNVSYSFNLQNTMFNNYCSDIIAETGEKIGESILNIVPYSVSLVCLSEYFVSKDLANSVVNWMSAGASEVFKFLGLNIQNVSKSATSAQHQYPEHIFETVVGVQGYVEWQCQKFDDQTVLHLLEKIKILYS